jgi:hypothetical protein
VKKEGTWHYRLTYKFKLDNLYRRHSSRHSILLQDDDVKVKEEDMTAWNGRTQGSVQWKVCRSMLMKGQVPYKGKNLLRAISRMNKESAIRTT